MYSRNAHLMVYLANLYVPQSKKADWKKLVEFMERNDLRKIEKTDAKKILIECLVVETRGRGTRETFSSWSYKLMNINHVSSTYAEVYIYSKDEQGYPSKIRTDNPKLSIIEGGVKL